MTNGKATEAQILQRNESRDVHMPRGALNTEGPKNQNPRPFAETARDKDGVPGLLSFTSWAATPAAQDLRGGSTQRAAHHIEMRGDSMRKKRNPLRDGSDENKQLHAVALNEGLRCKKRLWRERGRQQWCGFV
jgi:hypothetical protein